jgi:hypothetical protein
MANRQSVDPQVGHQSERKNNNSYKGCENPFFNATPLAFYLSVYF